MKNEFKNVLNDSKSYNSHSFKRTFVVPFISGVLGCSLVLGTCFGVPSIKEKLVGSNSSNNRSTSSSTSTGIVNNDLVSLSNYSDTAVYSASKILPSIVGISVTYNVTASSPFYGMFGGGGSTTSQATASGSGIIISEDGYIVTNNHVVSSASESTYYDISEATSLKVTLYGDNETQYDAKIVGKDSQTDLAVLKIDKSDLTPAEFADSDTVKVGEFAMAVGNPLDLGTTITCGVISALNREVKDSENSTTYKCIQTDAAINSGNSGGALVNSQGQVIGINTLKVSSTGVEGIGFAIPINSTTDIIDQLITYNTVKRPYIGISGRDLDEETAKKYNLVVGIYVVSVDDYSAAEKAGLKVSDVIIAADGKEITTMNQLNEIKNTHSVGDNMTLKINRDGQEKELTLTLGEQSTN